MEKKSYRVSSRVTKEMKDICKKLSKERNMSESDFITYLILKEDAMDCINNFLEEEK